MELSAHNAKFASKTKPFAERFDFLSLTGLDRSLDHMARTKLAEQNSLVHIRYLRYQFHSSN